MILKFKKKKETLKESPHIDVFADSLYIGYMIEGKGKFVVKGQEWVFFSKQELFKNCFSSKKKSLIKLIEAQANIIHNKPTYKLGVVEATTREELGTQCVNHIGLGLPPDDNIGKTCIFIEPNCTYEKDTFKIVGRQKMWGYDANGKYTFGIEGYRVVNTTYEDDFGKGAPSYRIKILN